MSGSMDLVVRSNPFRPWVFETVQAPEGLTLAEMLDYVGVPPDGREFLTVCVEDEEILTGVLHRVRPKAGTKVHVSARPMDGGGGQKNPLRIILTIAVIVVAIYAPYLLGYAGTVTGSLISAGISIAGMMLVNAIAPLPAPRLDLGDSSSTALLRGIRNEFRPFQPVPVPLGRHRMAPPFGAEPYTEVAGDDRWLRVLFIWGLGPMKLEDFRIGETPVTEFPGMSIETRGAYGDVETGNLALSFDGVDDQVIVGDVLDFPGLASFSIECHFKVDASATSTDELVSKLTTGGSIDGYRLYVDTVGLVVGFSRWLTNVADTVNAPILLGIEYHVAVTYDGVNMRMYLDGDEVPGSPVASSRALVDNVASLTLGAYSTIRHLEGKLDDVRIWDEARSRDEVVANMNKRLAGTEASLAGYWRADELDGTTLLDQTASGNDGTVTGAVQVPSPFQVVDNSPMSLFPGSVHEEPVGINIAQVDGWISRTSEPNADELSIDIFYPGGVRDITELLIEVQYAPAGTGAWINIDSVYIEGKHHFVTLGGREDSEGFKFEVTTPINLQAASFRSVRWNLEVRGQYDVRLKRVTADSPDGVTNTTIWAVLRSFTNEEPVNLGGLTKTAVRILQSDLVNGVLDQFNAVATSVVSTWNGTTWDVPAESSNPADLMVRVLTGPGNALPTPMTRVDVPRMVAFRARCEAEGWKYNGIVDYKATVWEVLSEIASSARASVAIRDGLWGVVEDTVKTTPVQHFTPRNSWGFSGSKLFTRRPHALRGKFLNELKNWELDEVTAYDDGYDSSNAALFEGFELASVTDPALVWRLLRLAIATARLRPEVYSLQTDVGHVMCTRGDLVRVTHDVPLIGLRAARVTAVTQDAGSPFYVLSVTVDAPVEMTLAELYDVRFMLSDGSSRSVNLQTTPGEVTELVLAELLLPADGPAVGDQAMVGLRGLESAEMLVLGIVPGQDLTARVDMVDYSPAIFDADTGLIPTFDPGTTLRSAGKPYILGVRSDSFVMQKGPLGNLALRIVITLGSSSARGVRGISSIEVAHRALGDIEWSLHSVSYPSKEVDVRDNLETGRVEQVKLRYRFADGTPGEWTYTVEERVVGLTDLPPDVEQPFFSDNELTWTYPVRPNDFAGFQVRGFPGSVNVQWANSVPMHDVLLSETKFNVAGFPAAPLFTFLIKALDVGGNESLNPARVIRGLGDRRLSEVLLQRDYRAEGWPGTLVDGTDIAGVLKADVDVVFWPTDDTLLWNESDSHIFWSGAAQKRMTYALTFLPPEYGLGGRLVVDVEAVGDPWQIQVRTGGEDAFWNQADTEVFWSVPDTELFWSAVPEDWRIWQGQIEATRQQYEFLVTTFGSRSVRGEIQELTVGSEVTLKTEVIPDFQLLAGGTRLPLTKTFKAILAIGYTIQGTGTAATVKTIDKNVILGPLAQGLEEDNVTPADALVDAVIQGY